MFGSFFLINLILAVIMQSFLKIHEQEIEELKTKYEQSEIGVRQKYDPGFKERQEKAKERESEVKEQAGDQGGSLGLLGQVLAAAKA